MKKYFIETYGCQMNFAQSMQLERRLKNNGFLSAGSSHSADIIIINACSVREHAEKRVFSRINHYNSLKKQGRNIQLLVTGCFAQNFQNKIDSDIVIGACRLSDIPALLKHAGIKNKTDGKYVSVEMDNYEFMTPVPDTKFPFRSMIDIMKGCDNFCSYCIVPYVKGRQASRKSSDVINEIKKLAGEGVLDITLLGQNVNSYGKDTGDIGFSELLYRINRIPGIRRIQFLTSHPKDFSDDIIASVFENEKVSAYIHMPLQSGSNKILKMMNRKYTIEKYHDIVEKIKTYQKDYSLSTDFLVGFPGETEKDFLRTIDAAGRIKFNTAFMFKYSARPYIAANDFTGEVDEREKSRRLKYLIDFQKKIEKDKIRESLNKIRSVLIEGKSRKDKNEFVGRDELNYQVILPEKAVAGKFYSVMIRDVKGTVLIGKKLSIRSDEKCA